MSRPGRYRVAVIDGIEVTEVGSGESLVVLVHGALGSGSSFTRVAAELESECRMLWYDRRGYGTSAGGGPAGVDLHAADLVAILDGRPAVVVGHSFGGVTVLGAAIRAPELVRSVVLYETSMAWSPGWDDTVVTALLSSPDPVEAALRMMLGERCDTWTDDEWVRRRVDGAAFVAEEASVRTGMSPYDVAEVRAPVVYGRSDTSVMPSVAAFLHQRLPQFEEHLIEGAGHHAHRTAPGAFADLVRRGIELAGV